MKTTTLTAAQKDKLSAAIKQALDHTLSFDNTAAYPRPKVEPADAFNVLDPNKNNAVDNTYIVIDNIPATYLVSFYWDGDYSIEPVTSEGAQIRVKVPSALVIAAGETVPQPIIVIYSVLNPNEPDGVASEPLQLTVRKYVRPAYPKPVITEAQGTELDVTALTANAHMTLAAWPGQAVGQKLWLSVVSTPQITLQNWNPLNVTTLGAQSRGISKDLLKTLTDGSTFILKLEASFDGGATRFPFSEQAYSIKSVPDVGAIEITKVTDSYGAEIANGGNTQETTVNLTGTADANTQLQVVDGSTVLGTVTVNAVGAWTYQANGLSVSTHIFTARYVAGGLTSDAWTVQVIAIPLTIDQSTMILDGIYVMGSPEWTQNGNDVVGNTQVRTPLGGTPPYTYSSSNTRYASVNQQGEVKGRGWGSSTITVSDARNNSVSYTVNASKMYALRVAPDEYSFTYDQAVQYAEDWDCLPLREAHLNVLIHLYGAPFPPDKGRYGDCWLGIKSGCGEDGLVWRFPSAQKRCAPVNEILSWRGMSILNSLDDWPDFP